MSGLPGQAVSGRHFKAGISIDRERDCVSDMRHNHFRAVAQILMAAVRWSWAWPSNPWMDTIIDHIGSVRSTYV